MNDINGNPWQEALDEQQNEDRNGILRQDLDAQRAMLADSENAARRDAQADAQKQLFMRNLIGTVVKRSGGNPISRRLANWANVALQKAGVRDIGIMTGGGFGDDGNFVVPTFSGVDQNGQPVAADGIKFEPKAVFSMMNQLRGIFSDSDRKAMADRLRDSGVGEEQIASMSYNPFETMMRDREQARRLMRRSPSDPDHIRNRIGGGAGGRQVGGATVFKGRDTRPHGVHSFSSDGQGGFSSMDWTPEAGETRRDWGTRDPNYQGRWKVRVNGPDGKVYENDKTGEEITVMPGENLRDVLARGIKETKARGGSGVEIAKINAASRENVAQITADSRKSVADANNKARMSIAEIGAELKRQGYEIDEKKLAEAIRHNGATERLGQDRLEHNRNRLENDKAQKEADRQLRRELAELQARAQKGVLGGGRGTNADALKSIQQLQKILDGGNLNEENRKSIKDRMNGIAADLDADKATVKSGDNNGDEKKLTGYRYNKSRTKRIPCYADGTEGSAEDVQ